MKVEFCDLQAADADVPPDVTHVYTSALTSPDEYWPLLTDEERRRADRFRAARSRDQFIAARGRLRLILSHYLDLAPRQIPFHYALNGKPHLPPQFDLHFNLSHTDGLGVFVISRSPVGVDVERERPVPDADDIAQRFFSPREKDLYLALAPSERPAAFLRAWTRKEAVLKANGRGVLSLDTCEVTFGPGETPRLVCLDGDPEAALGWELISWQAAPGYLAALAVCSRPISAKG